MIESLVIGCGCFRGCREEAIFSPEKQKRRIRGIFSILQLPPKQRWQLLLRRRAPIFQTSLGNRGSWWKGDVDNMPVHYVKVLPFGSARDVVAGLAIGSAGWLGLKLGLENTVF